MCEIKLNQILISSPSLIETVNRQLPHPLINRYDYILDEGEDIDH